jgi:hypothetical protein
VLWCDEVLDLLRVLFTVAAAYSLATVCNAVLRNSSATFAVVDIVRLSPMGDRNTKPSAVLAVKSIPLCREAQKAEWEVAGSYMRM